MPDERSRAEPPAVPLRLEMAPSSSRDIIIDEIYSVKSRGQDPMRRRTDFKASERRHLVNHAHAQLLRLAGLRGPLSPLWIPNGCPLFPSLCTLSGSPTHLSVTQSLSSTLSFMVVRKSAFYMPCHFLAFNASNHSLVILVLIGTFY